MGVDGPVGIGPSMGIRGLLGMASECPPGSSGDGARKLEAGMHASRPSACDGPAAGSIRRQVSDSSGPPRRLGGRLVNAACGLRVASQGWRRRRSEILSAQEMRSVAWPRTRRLISWSPGLRGGGSAGERPVPSPPSSRCRPRRNARLIKEIRDETRMPSPPRAKKIGPAGTEVHSRALPGATGLAVGSAGGTIAPRPRLVLHQGRNSSFFFAALAADGARDRRADRG